MNILGFFKNGGVQLYPDDEKRTGLSSQASFHNKANAPLTKFAKGLIPEIPKLFKLFKPDPNERLEFLRDNIYKVK